jgi:hypothetical protein
VRNTTIFRRSRESCAAARCVLLASVAAAFALLTGCGPVKLVATAQIPEPLVVKIPVAVALFIPPEFSEYVHEEERWGTDYSIALGKAQSDAISRLMNAMFEEVIPVDSLNAGAQLGERVAAILEPSVEEYAFVTPRDAGSPFYAVSIKYRVNVYRPDGKLADSWGFTGYGTSPAGGLSNTEPLVNATALAMRDAGAKLAVEFREQAIVRGLLPEAESDTSAGGETSDEAAPAQTEATDGETPEEVTPPEAAPAEESSESDEDSNEAETAPAAPRSESAPTEEDDRDEEESQPELDGAFALHA